MAERYHLNTARQLRVSDWVIHNREWIVENTVDAVLQKVNEDHDFPIGKTSLVRICKLRGCPPQRNPRKDKGARRSPSAILWDHLHALEARVERLETDLGIDGDE